MDNRSLHYKGSGRYEWQHVATPTIEEPTDALVRPIAVTSCDLDGAVAEGGLDGLGVDYPVGHEFVADVLAVGDEVEHTAVGDRVVVSFQVSCGTCRPCGRGKSGFCSEVRPAPTFGLPDAAREFGGALSDVLRVPWVDVAAIGLPSDFGPAAAAVSDNFCDGWRTVAPYLDRSDGPILIDGYGSVGMYAVGVAVAEGREVHYRDRDAGRRSRAEALGARTYVEPEELPSRLYDLVVNSSPVDSDLVAAANAVGRLGTLVTTGIHIRPTTPVPIFHLYMHGATIVNEMISAASLMPKAMAWLADHPMDLDDFIDVRAAWDEADTALAAGGGKLLIVREEAWAA